MIISALLLLCLGIAVIYSSSPILAIQQFFFGLLGLVFYISLRASDYRSFGHLTKFLYFTILFLLIVTLFLGIETRGSVRWIPIGPFNLQPSEFAKPIIILTLSRFWTKNLPTWGNIFKSFAIIAPLGLLIFRQPDLGTAVTIVFIWVVMVLAANTSFLKMAMLSILSLILAPIVWFNMQDYQKLRLIGFLSPGQDPRGIGFHVIQSTIAVGSGQLLGRGLGRGTQSRLQFLPEFRTDFIFAFIAEELGFIGSSMVLILYAVIFFVFLKVLNNTGDRFGELITIGVMGMLFFQITVNVGMNVGILPITGITLPLLSYGGSSVAATLISMGLVASVAKYGVKRQNVDTFGS